MPNRTNESALGAHADEVRQLVGDFLDLVRDGERPGNVAVLARLLDRLALAQHTELESFDDADHPDPPAWPYDERRQQAESSFPQLGYYNVALDVAAVPGTSACAVGDAIDDIADIAGDLADVRWCFEHTSEADALWHFRALYDLHWGKHLRRLQLYLHERRAAGEDSERSDQRQGR